MPLKRISPGEMTQAIIDSFAECISAPQTRDSMQVIQKMAIAQAQLEADLKAHNAVIREIKEGLETALYRPHIFGKLSIKDSIKLAKMWQEFWQKYPGGG